MKSFILLILLFSCPIWANPTIPVVNYQLIDTGLVWQQKQLKVCWEVNSLNQSENSFATEKNIVKDAALDTWAKYSQIEFIGWQNCNEDDEESANIKLIIGDGSINPNLTKHYNSQSKYQPKMYHNFTFTNWSPSCASSESYRLYCIRVIAVHEFGHALGFFHEQNRDDTPKNWCLKEPQGSNGDLVVGGWDLYSVMNYCNPSWNGDGKLSRMDIKSVQAIYGVGQVVIEDKISEQIKSMAFGNNDLQVFLTLDNSVKYRFKGENFKTAPPFPSPNQDEIATALKTVEGETYAITNSKSIYRLIIGGTDALWILIYQNRNTSLVNPTPNINITDFFFSNHGLTLIDENSNLIDGSSNQILTDEEKINRIGVLPTTSSGISKIEIKSTSNYGQQQSALTLLDKNNHLFFKNCQYLPACGWSEITNPENRKISEFKVDLGGKLWILDDSGKVFWIDTAKNPIAWTALNTLQKISHLDLDMSGNPQFIDENGNFINLDDQCREFNGVKKFKCLQNLGTLIESVHIKDRYKEVLEESLGVIKFSPLLKLGFSALHAAFIAEASITLANKGVCAHPSYLNILATTALVFKAEISFSNNVQKLKEKFDGQLVNMSEDQVEYIESLIKFSQDVISTLSEYKSDYNWLTALYFSNVPIALGEVYFNAPCLSKNKSMTSAILRASFSALLGTMSALISYKISTLNEEIKTQTESLQRLKSNIKVNLQSFINKIIAIAIAGQSKESKICIKNDYSLDLACGCLKNNQCLKVNNEKLPQKFKNDKKYKLLFDHLNNSLLGANANLVDNEKLEAILSNEIENSFQLITEANARDPQKYKLTQSFEQLLTKINQLKSEENSPLAFFTNKISTSQIEKITKPEAKLIVEENLPNSKNRVVEKKADQYNSNMHEENEYIVNDVHENSKISLWKIISNRYLTKFH